MIKHIGACGCHITPNEGKRSKAQTLKVPRFPESNGYGGQLGSVLLKTSGAGFYANELVLPLTTQIAKKSENGTNIISTFTIF